MAEFTPRMFLELATAEPHSTGRFCGKSNLGIAVKPGRDIFLAFAAISQTRYRPVYIAFGSCEDGSHFRDLRQEVCCHSIHFILFDIAKPGAA